MDTFWTRLQTDKPNTTDTDRAFDDAIYNGGIFGEERTERHARRDDTPKATTPTPSLRGIRHRAGHRAADALPVIFFPRIESSDGAARPSGPLVLGLALITCQALLHIMVTNLIPETGQTLPRCAAASTPSPSLWDDPQRQPSERRTVARHAPQRIHYEK